LAARSVGLPDPPGTRQVALLPRKALIAVNPFRTLPDGRSPDGARVVATFRFAASGNHLTALTQRGFLACAQQLRHQHRGSTSDCCSSSTSSSEESLRRPTTTGPTCTR